MLCRSFKTFVLFLTREIILSSWTGYCIHSLLPVWFISILMMASLTCIGNSSDLMFTVPMKSSQMQVQHLESRFFYLPNLPSNRPHLFFKLLELKLNFNHIFIIWFKTDSGGIQRQQQQFCNLLTLYRPICMCHSLFGSWLTAKLVAHFVFTANCSH